MHIFRMRQIISLRFKLSIWWRVRGLSANQTLACISDENKNHCTQNYEQCFQFQRYFMAINIRRTNTKKLPHKFYCDTGTKFLIFYDLSAKNLIYARTFSESLILFFIIFFAFAAHICKPACTQTHTCTHASNTICRFSLSVFAQFLIYFPVFVCVIHLPLFISPYARI